MRYFFNVWFKGQYVTDHEGTEFGSDDQAQAEAFASALELEREFPHTQDNSAMNVLEVVDENGSGSWPCRFAEGSAAASHNRLAKVLAAKPMAALCP